MWDFLIVDLFSALLLSLCLLILNFQCVESAKEVNNERVPHFYTYYVDAFVRVY